MSYFLCFPFFFRKFLQMRWQSLIEKSSINVKMKFQKKKKNMLNKCQKWFFPNILQHRCSYKFHKFHRKALMLESLFKKVAGLNPRFLVNLASFSEEIFNGKLHFLCRVTVKSVTKALFLSPILLQQNLPGNHFLKHLRKKKFLKNANLPHLEQPMNLLIMFHSYILLLSSDSTIFWQMRTDERNSWKNFLSHNSVNTL